MLIPTGSVCDRLLAIRDGCVNMFIVRSAQGFVCIDTGWSVGRMTRNFHALGLDSRDAAAVFVTHLHWDHARCIDLFSNARLFIGVREPLQRRRKQKIIQSCERIDDGEVITVAGIHVRAFATPGHTCGSTSYLVDGRFLFTGDTLRLRRGTVVPFAPWCCVSCTDLDQSIHKLAQLDGVEYLLTAHSGFSHNPCTAFSTWREPEIRRGEI